MRIWSTNSRLPAVAQRRQGAARARQLRQGGAVRTAVAVRPGLRPRERPRRATSSRRPSTATRRSCRCCATSTQRPRKRSPAREPGSDAERERSRRAVTRRGARGIVPRRSRSGDGGSDGESTTTARRFGSERVREALVGYAFVADPARALRPLLHLPDRLRVLHQLPRLGRHRGEPRLRRARQLPRALARPPVLDVAAGARDGALEHRLLRTPRRPAADGARADAGADRERADPRRTFFRVGVLLPGADVVGGDLRDRDLHPQRGRAPERRHQRGDRPPVPPAVVRRPRHGARVDHRPERAGRRRGR